MLRSDGHPSSRTRSATGARQSFLVAAVTTLVLLFAAAVPAWATSGPTSLVDPTVSPRSGTTLTTVVFTVSFRNREGSAADWVRVKVGSTVHGMTSTGGSDWKRGVTFRWSGKLPVGTHAVSMEALSRDHFSDAITAGSVTITNPPAPDPTPKPTPKPSPKPVPKPAPKPTGAPPAPPTAGPTTDPTSGPASATDGPGATASPTPSPAPSDDAIAVVPGATAGPGGGSDPGTDPAVRSGGSGSGPGPDQGPLGALAAAADLLTSGHPTLPLGLVATLATTSTVVGATLAFGLFGKRRRDGEPPAPDDVLAAAAGARLAVAEASAFIDRSAHGGPSAAAVADAPSPHDAELQMPRWRRPSLLEARRADPIRDATSAPRLTFDHGLVGPLEGRERRLIRYSLVRLLDMPDELRGNEIAFLDQGDEVQLLEKRGVYWLVLCPDGRQGWIHKMTLGDTVGEPHIQSPTATMPIAAETWTLGDDVDGDVLAAYLESRRRA